MTISRSIYMSNMVQCSKAWIRIFGNMWGGLSHPMSWMSTVLGEKTTGCFVYAKMESERKRKCVRVYMWCALGCFYESERDHNVSPPFALSFLLAWETNAEEECVDSKRKTRRCTKIMPVCSIVFIKRSNEYLLMCPHYCFLFAVMWLAMWGMMRRSLGLSFFAFSMLFNNVFSMHFLWISCMLPAIAC